MRLIDADALKNQVCIEGDCTQCKTGVNEKVCKWNMIQLNDAVERLESAPTIDAVPVVRCKDCVSFHYSGMGGDDGITYCAPMGLEMQPTDFCSYGERKNNE